MTYKATLTQHAQIRAQQRAVPMAIIDILMRYGVRSSANHGCKIVYLSNKSMRRIHYELSDDLCKVIEKKRDCYLVVASDGSVVTVGHRHKRILH